VVTQTPGPSEIASSREPSKWACYAELMTRWPIVSLFAVLLVCASTGCEKKEPPANEVGANLGLSASSKPASPVGHEATHIQQQKPTSSAPGGNKTETVGGNKSLGVNTGN
jgi:hypothetical protein